MGKIRYYLYDGTLNNEVVLTESNLAITNGMLIRCKLRDGSFKVGYSDPYKSYFGDPFLKVEDYIYLVTWDNLDEEKHELVGSDEIKYSRTYTKVNIEDIESVDAILYSNPKWGGQLTNKFEFYPQENSAELVDVELPPFLKDRTKIDLTSVHELTNKFPDDELLYTYVSAVYDDDIVAKTIGEPSFYYKTDKDDISIGDKVLVDRQGEKIVGEVVDIEYVSEDDLPYPLDKTKDIINIIKKNK